MKKQKRYYVPLTEKEMELIADSLWTAADALGHATSMVVHNSSANHIPHELDNKRVDTQRFLDLLLRRFEESKKGS